MKTVEEMIDDIIDREGGYVDHPADKGGPTKWGITQMTLEKWRGTTVTDKQVQALPQSEARQIYWQRYYADAGIDKFPEALQAQAFDINVNGGLKPIVDRVTSYFGAPLQEVVNFLGPKTANIILAASRIEYYRRITNSRPANKAFILGWLNRAAEFTEWE